VHPDGTVLFATALCALLATMIFGLLAALSAGRTEPGILLKSRTAGASRQTAGRAFVPIQVGLSLTLVIPAALLSQSLARLRSEHTGFDVDHVTIQTAPFNLLHEQGDARLRMVERIGQMPGIESAAFDPFPVGQDRSAKPILSHMCLDTGNRYTSIPPGWEASTVPSH
jgi:hypothetical protein